MTDTALLDTAFGRAPADVLITGGQLVNVLSGEIYAADVAITGGRIAATGDVADRRGPDTEIIDATGQYLVPGLIDGHLHIECSKLSVSMFGSLVSRYGTTSALSGLDQVLVVAGLDGVREFLDESRDSGFRIFWGAPAKAPYTVPESNVGHRFGPEEHRIAQTWEECYGLWETVQEFVEHGDAEVLSAIDMGRRNRLRPFGCAPMADARRIAGQAAAGIALDHESYSAEEMLEKLRNGINVIIRQSTAAPFLAENIRVITELGAQPGRVAFCTDDVSASEILGHGHLDALVRQAIEIGLPPMTAIQMATINCATMYRIDEHVGSLAPGRFADVLLVDDLADFRAQRVIAGGRLVAQDGHPVQQAVAPQRSAALLESMKRPPVAADDLRVPAEGQSAQVLAMSLSEDVAFVRTRKDATLPVRDGAICADTEQDVLYVTVAERYGKTSNLPVAFVHGFGLRQGAIATSASPDDNNVVCVGTNREDMALAINELGRAGGGQVVVVDGQVQDLLPLPVGGIVADLQPEEMAERERALDDRARDLGSRLPSAFWYLMFLSITAIPDYAITDLGLIDCRVLEPVSPIIEPAQA